MRSAGEHISFEQLIDLAEERVEPALAGPLREHLTGCPECAREFDWVVQTITIMREDELEDAPEHVIARAVRALNPAPATERPSGLRRLLASLEFDSGGFTPAFGMRSGQPISRQLLFEAGDVNLDIRLTPEQEHWTVAGQILGECEPGTVEIRGAGTTYTADLNELCEFLVQAVPTGRYTLHLRYADTEVEIPTLEIGQGHASA